jgi:hypothetical protein
MIDPSIGFAIADANSFGATREVVEDVRRLAMTHMADAAALTTPDHFGKSLAHLPLSSPLVRFALGDQLLATVSAYLGMVPLLTDLQIMRASHIPGGPTASQRFHCDHDDLRQVKVFVLCSTVTEANGPLTLLNAVDSQRVKRSVQYRYGGKAMRLTDEQVAQLSSGADLVPFTGEPGRVCLADTSTCLHFGARVNEGAEDRYMVQFQYMTPAAFDLFLRQNRATVATPAAGSSEIVRLALGA